MKNLFFPVVIISLLLSSCSEDFLDRTPISEQNVQNFYKTPEDLELAVNGAYASLQSQYTLMYVVGEVRSDNTGSINQEAIFDEFLIDVKNNSIENIWDSHYAGLSMVNTALDRMEQVEGIDQDLRSRYRGELKFLRGLMYFNLVRIYGDVPLVLNEVKSIAEAYEFGREDTSVVYEQIIQDLEEASQNLPGSFSGDEIGRATSGAAHALLAKVFLTLKDYEAAKIALEEVISSNEYNLLSNYASLFDPGNANNAESVFEVQYKKGGLGTGSVWNNYFSPRNSGTIVSTLGGSRGRNYPTDDLISAYEPDDIRKDVSLAEGYTDEDGEFVDIPYPKKYLDTPFQNEDSDNNWYVLRYGDVLLMYAEVLNEINNGPTSEAFEAINEVRNRAGLDDLDENLDYDAFALAVEQERRVELAFEAHRWFDLVRTDRALEVMTEHFENTEIYEGVFIEEYHLIFPVPQSEIDINPDEITQNPGYSF